MHGKHSIFQQVLFCQSSKYHTSEPEQTQTRSQSPPASLAASKCPLLSGPARSRPRQRSTIRSIPSPSTHQSPSPPSLHRVYVAFTPGILLQDASTPRRPPHAVLSPCFYRHRSLLPARCPPAASNFPSFHLRPLKIFQPPPRQFLCRLAHRPSLGTA